VSYRETALACPDCGEVLAPQLVDEATIDVCPGCAGVWVDWFDGDLGAMVRGAPTAARGAAPAQVGNAACPRCTLPLTAERWQESRAHILRCGGCAGAFVPRDAAEVIAAADPDGKGGPPPAADAWSRLAAVLQRWFGWEEKP
jgi:Zn-finger nucleic acid-binding protein